MSDRKKEKRKKELERKLFLIPVDLLGKIQDLTLKRTILHILSHLFLLESTVYLSFGLPVEVKAHTTFYSDCHDKIQRGLKKLRQLFTMFSCRNCGTSTNIKGLPFRNKFSVQRHEQSCRRFGRRDIPKQYVSRCILLSEEARKIMEENKTMFKECSAMQHEERIIRRFELKHILEKQTRNTRITETVQQVNWESLSDCQKQLTIETTVAVKADGIRSLIHCDLDGNCVALMCEWCVLDSKWKWYVHELGKAKVHNMFLLGAVLVGAEQPVYLCHDVHYWQQPKMSGLLEVSRALGKFLKEVSLSTLAWKPQHPITAAYELLLQRTYPYPTDGLILTRCRPKTPVRYGDVSPFDVWKWQPAHNLTFDFLLGNSSPSTEGLQFRLHVGTSLIKPFNLPGYPSFLTFAVSDDEIPLFTRGRVVEVRWDSVVSKWIFLRFRRDKETPNSAKAVKQKLDLIVCPLPIETVIETRELPELPDTSARDTLLTEAEEALSHLDLTSVKVKETSTPSAMPTKRGRAFPLLPPLVVIRDLLPFLQLVDIFKFRRTCVDAYHMTERVRLLEHHDAYLESKKNRVLNGISNVYVSRFGTLGFVQQLLGVESVEALQLLAAKKLYPPRTTFFDYDSYSEDEEYYLHAAAIWAHVADWY